MLVEHLTPEHDAWNLYLAHMERAKTVRHVMEDDGSTYKSDTYFLGIRDGQRFVGHLSLRQVAMMIPQPGQQAPIPIRDAEGNALKELFVQTFFVEEPYRNQGLGRALQESGLELAKELGCYQMRSWSTLDRYANYALKVAMGFAVQPATYQMPNGEQVCGAYFVKIVK